jgi:hypothetical protein
MLRKDTAGSRQRGAAPLAGLLNLSEGVVLNEGTALPVITSERRMLRRIPARAHTLRRAHCRRSGWQARHPISPSGPHPNGHSLVPARRSLRLSGPDGIAQDSIARWVIPE